VTGAATGIRERVALRRHELPVVAAGPEGQLDDPVDVRGADLAVRLDRPEAVRLGAAGSHHELANPERRIGRTRRRLRSEPLVLVVVTVEDHVGTAVVGRVVVALDERLTPVHGARREERVVPVHERAGGRPGREVGSEPLFLGGLVAVWRPVEALRVHDRNVPGPEVVAVVGAARVARARAEERQLAREVPGVARQRAALLVAVVVRAGRRPRPRSRGPPGRVVAIGELLRRPGGIGVVAERRDDRVREVPEQRTCQRVGRPGAAGDVAGAHQHSVGRGRGRVDRERVRRALAPVAARVRLLGLRRVDTGAKSRRRFDRVGARSLRRAQGLEGCSERIVSCVQTHGDGRRVAGSGPGSAAEGRRRARCHAPVSRGVQRHDRNRVVDRMPDLVVGSDAVGGENRAVHRDLVEEAAEVVGASVGASQVQRQRVGGQVDRGRRL
jgi:hypothetical protein